MSQARELARRWAEWSRTVPVLRVPAVYGWTRSAHVVAAVLWAVFLANTVVAVRPDLLFPGSIGSDSTNYVAAAERLADGGPIYGLRPGDRPVPLDNAPNWTVPILSPPTVPTLFLPTVLAPPSVRPYIIWSIGLAGTIAAGFLLALTAPIWVLLIALVFAPGLADTAWSGNANALIATGIPIVYAAGTSTDRRVAMVGGLVLGAITLLKLGPILFIPWLIGSRRWMVVAVAASTILVGLAATVAIAGFDAFGGFIAVARSSVAQPLTWSVPAIAERLGLPAPVSTPLLALVLGVVGLYALRAPRQPSAFVLSAIAAMVATTVVRVEGIAVSAVSGTAYRSSGPATGGALARGRASPTRLASGLGVVAATAAVVWSIASGGLQSSSMTITNDTDAAVVIRFDVPAQAASFGYVVEPAGTDTAWHDGGGSAAVAFAWTSDCRLLAEMRLPRTGGHLTVSEAGLQLDPVPRDGARLAVPNERCSLALKARLESVPGATR
jgi:hypothetical protein